jgi:hypothetical protein
VIAWGVRSHPRAERVHHVIVAQTATIGYIRNSVILRQVLDSYIPMKYFLLTFLIALTATVSSNAQTLQVDPIYVGGDATFKISNGSPLAVTVVCYSLVGTGPYTLANGLVFDLSMPIRQLQPMVLDISGNGQLGPFSVPNRAVPGMHLWFQAVHVDPLANPSTTTTNMVPIVVGAASGSLVSWGWDCCSQVTDTPAGYDFVQISGGQYHSVALRADGSLVSWGGDAFGLVTDTPAGYDFVQVSAGFFHSVALRTDGSIVSWGRDNYLAVSDTPTTNDFTQVSAGGDLSIALRTDGTLVSWGRDDNNVISNTPLGHYFTQVSAGYDHAVALRADGSLVSWGWDAFSCVTDTPTSNDFTQASGGKWSSAALRADGSLVSWGGDLWGQVTDAPISNDFIQVSAGFHHSVAIKN